MIIAILTCTLAFANIGGHGFEAQLPPEEPTEIMVEETTVVDTVPVETVEYIPLPTYSVNGACLDYGLQMFLRDQLAARGCGWFFVTALCQIYGESRYNVWAENSNGLDKGLCQCRETYWNTWAAQIGWPGASIWDPYAQIAVYAMLMSGYLYASNYDTNMALSMYYLGTDGYAAEYVAYITGFFDTIREVR